MTTRSGQGTLYDLDENELSAVTYRIEQAGDAAGPVVDWSGSLALAAETPDLPLDAGRYLLAFEDGTRSEIALEPTGAASGAGGELAFTGAGVLGAATTTA